MRLLLIGKRRPDLDWASDVLWRYHGFKKIRMIDATDKMIRYFYMVGQGRRIRWEKRAEFYDALYKMDPEIHINFMLKRLSITEREDIVIDDVRYINELQALRNVGFKVIRVGSSSKAKRVLKGIKNLSEGSIILREHFGEQVSKINADYSMYIDTRETGYKSLQLILDTIRNDTV